MQTTLLTPIAYIPEPSQVPNIGTLPLLIIITKLKLIKEKKEKKEGGALLYNFLVVFLLGLDYFQTSINIAMVINTKMSVVYTLMQK